MKEKKSRAAVFDRLRSQIEYTELLEAQLDSSRLAKSGEVSENSDDVITLATEDLSG